MRKMLSVLYSFNRFLLSVFSVFSVAGFCAASTDKPTYWADIRPVLRKSCTVCHSAKNLGEPDVSGGIALDSFEVLLKGTKRRVLKPGLSKESLLVKMITISDADRRMPLGAPPLGSETVDLLRRWIDQGVKEGTKSEQDPVLLATSGKRHRHKQDIALATNYVPPRGLTGKNRPGKLEMALRVGPLPPVAAVVFSPDGKLLATGSYRQVTIWDVSSTRPVKTLSNVLGTVNDLRFSPDGRLLAVAGGQPSAKGDLRLYRVADWGLAAVLSGHDDVVYSVAFDLKGKRLASASFDKTVRLWDLKSYKSERILTGHSDSVYSVAFSPDGKSVVSASKDRSVKITDADSGKSRLTLSGMNEDVLAVAVTPDGQRVVASGLEPALRWWNLSTGERVRMRGQGHGGPVNELCFDRDGSLLASASSDKTVRLWRGSGAALRTISVGAIVYAVALSPDGKLVATGSFDGLVKIWDTAKGRLLLTLLDAADERNRNEWLALTPEGYLSGSDELRQLATWKMGGGTVDPEPIWKTLRHPEMVARAMRGEKLAAPK
jgi:WD40 repeat protein